jgi:hypothetical protein
VTTPQPDIAEKIIAAIAEREQLAQAEGDDGFSDHESWHTRRCGYGQGEWLEPCDCAVPAAVLRDCAADREIVTEVTSWKHEYNDADQWYSCGLAVDPHNLYNDQSPGSGCADDDKHGTCTCFLAEQQSRILGPLVRGYGIQP